MTLLDFLLLLLVAGVCGAVGRALAGSRRGGVLVSIALGFVGALVGMWLARLMGLPAVLALDLGSTAFPLVWSVIGAALFMVLLGWISRRPV